MHFLIGCFLLSPDDLSDRLRHPKPDTGAADADTDIDVDSSADSDISHDSPADSNADSNADSAPDSDDSGERDSGDTGDTADTAVETCWTLRFTDPTDYATDSDGGRASSSPAWTVEAWVYYDGTPGYIFQKWSYGAEDRQLRINNAGLIVAAFYLDDGTAHTMYGPAIALEEWTHIAAQIDEVEETLYVNGELASTIAVTADVAVSKGAPVFGYIDRDGTVLDSFAGAISDVRVSSTARYSANFIPDAHPPLDINTVAMWRFDDGPAAGKQFTDETSGSPSGVIDGAEWYELPCR